MINCGSDWKKWDFHVHTKGTNKNDQFTSKSMDEFFYQFFKKASANKISAIGITDYFSIEMYQKAIDYQNKIESRMDSNGQPLFNNEEIDFIKNIFLFPNVELRMMPATDKGRLINIHCLFNPKIVESLEHDFFSKIKNQDDKLMTRQGITDYGKSLYPNTTDTNLLYKKGIENYAINIDTLKKLLNSNRALKDNMLVVVSNSSTDGASGTQKHYDLFENEPGSLDGIRKSIYCLSDAIFSSNCKDIKYFLGKKSVGSETYNEQMCRDERNEVIRSTGSLKPCLVGCDAHTESDLFEKKEGIAFTWIKADLNFEGLKQVCLEPEQRVKIQNERPDFKEEKLLINKVQFISPNNIFSTKPIYLNPNLNVIIGGKSSGKSILLYAIAKTIYEDTESSILKNEDKSELYDFKKIESEFDFEVTSKGGIIQRLSNRNQYAENSIIPEIKYIPQNYLVKLAEKDMDKTSNPLNKLVRRLITENIEAKKLYENFLSTVTKNDKSRNSLIDLYFQTHSEIDELGKDLKTKSNKDVLNNNIQTNSKRIEELTQHIGLSKEQIKKYKKTQKKLEANNVKKTQVNNDFDAIKNFNSELEQIISSLKKLKKNNFLSSSGLPEIENYYKETSTIFDSFYDKIYKLEDSLKSKINGILTTLDTEEKELNQEIQLYSQNEEEKKLIEQLKVSIFNDKRLLADLDKLTESIDAKKQDLDKIKVQIFDLYSASYREYTNIIENLKVRTNELKKDGLSIEGKVKFNFTNLRKKLLDVSDKRTASYRDYSILKEEKKSIDELDYDVVRTEIERLFTKIIEKDYAISSRTTIPDVIKIVLNDYFFDYWEITYKNDKLGEMSTGKASFVILMLIIGLSSSKAPILIDQPEDNLDNRSITTDLVHYLREKKLERQIIIVTHNANIVVNADAENIIVANQKGQNNDNTSSPFQFDYINGSIENSFDRKDNEADILKSMGIRQHIADIVEGGKEAFKKRERKYRFN
ncbi:MULTISPECIES: TrlF family AAA-like ATPase [unclassified Gilliamella]|uniref:TrlF family AAA-like ATPase n=1 Tax=unclassified Gilliamella TaxID=2685620 RepID=UPI001328B2FC|nr:MULTISPECIES: hypothetical protein [unclassified Gilliamella]MWN31165.1 hypothetical protein [Gilliamella sp. Pra-s60]MWP29782.1 hypothetical protein [Gilliamella sp. Pra-s54]